MARLLEMFFILQEILNRLLGGYFSCLYATVYSLDTGYIAGIESPLFGLTLS